MNSKKNKKDQVIFKLTKQVDCHPAYDNRLNININKLNYAKVEDDFRTTADKYQELPTPFVKILQLIQQLQSMRIIQKVSRPTQPEQKMRFISKVNQKIALIQQNMNFIRDNSSKFKIAQVAHIKIQKNEQAIQQNVNVDLWKQGIRKVVSRLQLFYKQKLLKLQKINRCMNLSLTVSQLDYKQWMKLKQTTSFCFCL